MVTMITKSMKGHCGINDFGHGIHGQFVWQSIHHAASSVEASMVTNQPFNYNKPLGFVPMNLPPALVSRPKRTLGRHPIHIRSTPWAPASAASHARPDFL